MESSIDMGKGYDQLLLIVDKSIAVVSLLCIGDGTTWNEDASLESRARKVEIIHNKISAQNMSSNGVFANQNGLG